MTTASGVVQLARTQVKDAGEVLARAFQDDPIWLWVQPDESRRARLLSWFMDAWVRYCHKRGEVQTTAGKVEGAAVWIPPGKFPLSVVAMLLAGWILAPLKFGPAAYGRFSICVNEMERLHKRDVPARHWYLATLGVDPPRQGQGVGGALLQPVMARADADGLPCYLETEKEINVTFYKRHGFDVVVETDLPRDGPHIWTMKREPFR
jgi:ribosomal protein S18 acetylase RimI-like enzyme